jgi:hypothetical protein
VPTWKYFSLWSSRKYLESILRAVSLLILLPLKEQYHGSVKNRKFISKLVKS